MKLYSLDRRNGNTRIYDGGNADVKGVFDAHNACRDSGPEAGKLTPKIQRSSLILYLIYIFLTIAEGVRFLFAKCRFLIR